MKALLILPFLAIPSLAHADQCAIVDDAVATRAVAALRSHPMVIEYCEPCNDPAPGAPRRIDRAVKIRDNAADARVTLDGRDVDLAYTYVQTAPLKYENLAKLAGCPASDVSPSLVVNDASDTGIIITAGKVPATYTEPVEARSEELADEPAYEPAPRVVTPTVTCVVQSEDHVGLLAMLAACIATSGLWAFATMRLLRRRRDTAMRPRALELRGRDRDA